MRKIVFITSRLPFPATDGRKNMLLQYIRQMKEIWPDSEIVNLSFVDEPDDMKHRPAEIARFVLLKLPGLAEKLFNVLLHSVVRRSWPLQVSVYYRRKTHRLIREWMRREQPDLVVYDMVRTAQYRTEGPGRSVLSYDDLLSLRYRRQLGWFRYIPSVLGGFADKLPGGWQKLAGLKFIQKRLVAFESGLLARYEIRAAHRFDHLVFTSPAEAAAFRETTLHRSCHGLPMAVAAAPAAVSGGGRRYDPHKIVFVGKMDIPHNSSAAVYFCRRVWPRIRSRAPDAVFYIVGKSPVPEVRRLQDECPGVVVTGEVADVAAAVRDAALMVAPLLFGTGIKTKILEAMSWGVPVVTNAVGSEGLGATGGEELLLCESEDEMARGILRLMGDRELNDYVSGNAARYVARQFGGPALQRKLELILS